MSESRKPRVAIAYDFDGTLSPGNMQEYDFIPELGIKPSDFWAEVKERAKAHEADEILSYMTMMLDKANRSEKVKVTQKAFFNYGQGIPFFKGLDTWFDRINKFALESRLDPEHYIISSGIREMIVGTEISHRFVRIFASSFIYDKYDVAQWPGMAINYTNKTQFLFRISKGALDVWDSKKVNQYFRPNEFEVPFANMIYIGDGETDIPCMKLVKDKGGHSIAVFNPEKGQGPVTKSLLENNRVNIVLPADYSEGSPIEKFVKAVILKISASESVLSHYLKETENA